MQLEFFELTSIGNRTANQDYMAHIVTDNYALFIVADGLGGHHAGEKASQFFCQGMLKLAQIYCKVLAQNPVQVFSDWINAAITEMKVLFTDDQLAEKAHTTCAVLYLNDNITMTAHCGDSRIYRMNPKEILWRTQDHSVPQELFDAGMISELEIAQHPEQNQLTRSINVRKNHKIDINMYPAMALDETFVLCSDGFWGYAKQDELLQLADPKSNQAHLTKLARLCVYRAMGKSDNVTVMSVRCRK
jgi:protein phosphatase